MKHAGLVTGLIIQLIVSLTWSRITPVFEAPDEFAHTDLIQRMADGAPRAVIPGTSGALNRPVWSESALAHHPPLYYAALGGMVRLLAADGLRPTPISRERATDPAGYPFTLRWAHGHDESTIRSAEVRRFHLLRSSSVLFGALSLILTYVLARRAAPGIPAAANSAVLLLAAVPTWTYSHGVLDNGNLAVTWILAALVVMTSPPRPGLFRGLTLGVFLAAALATKLTALFLPGVVLGALLLRRISLGQAAIAMALAAASLGPFVARNLELYGEPLGSAAHAAAFEASRIPEGYLGTYFRDVFPGQTVRTLMMRLGANDLHAAGAPIPIWIPATFLTLLALALIGAFLPARRRGQLDSKNLILLALATLGCVAIYVRFNLVFRQAQGRYLLPALPALAIFVALGFEGVRTRLPKLSRLALPLIAASIGLGAAHLYARPQWSFDPDQVGPYASSLTAGLRSSRANLPARLEQPGASVTWTSQGLDGQPVSLHLELPEAHFVAGTLEHRGLIAGTAESGSYLLPSQLLPTRDGYGPLRWKIRVLPDRSRGIHANTALESPWKLALSEPDPE